MNIEFRYSIKGVSLPFKLDKVTGLLQVNSLLDFEAEKDYEVTIVAKVYSLF